MKGLKFSTAIFLLLVTTLTSCELVGDIFQAGFNTAIFLGIIVFVIIIWIVLRMRKR